MATISTNVDKGKKRKIVGTKTVTTPGKSTEVAISKAKPASTIPGGKSDYVKADERTGAPSYGKESKTKPTPQFIKDAQAKGQNIVERNGKKYQAGTTRTIKVSRDISATPAVKVKLPGLPVTKQVPVYEKPAGKKIKRLKPMGMTYGTVNKKDEGGTKYKKRVRAH